MSDEAVGTSAAWSSATFIRTLIGASKPSPENKSTLADHSPLIEFVVDFIGPVSYDFGVEDRQLSW